MNGPRIMIVGGPGAGKSWLASRVQTLTKIPLYSVDDAVHDENELVQPNKVIDEIVISWVEQDTWIIEGGNTRTYEYRLLRATHLIVLEPPRWLRVLRIMRRQKMNKSLLYWSWKYDQVFGSKNKALVENAGLDTAVHIATTKTQMKTLLNCVSKL